MRKIAVVSKGKDNRVEARQKVSKTELKKHEMQTPIWFGKQVGYIHLKSIIYVDGKYYGYRADSAVGANWIISRDFVRHLANKEPQKFEWFCIYTFK